MEIRGRDIPGPEEGDDDVASLQVSKVVLLPTNFFHIWLQLWPYFVGIIFLSS